MGAVIQGRFAGSLPLSVVLPPVVGAGAVQRSAAAPGAGERSVAVNPAVLGVIGAGQPLPAQLRPQLERLVGADLSGVRVHVGPQAARIGAIAFTTGSNIFFAPGQYQPQTAIGRQLLGHELAHVVQQRQGRVQNRTGAPMAVVQNQALELEADRLGQRVAALLGAKQWDPGAAVGQAKPAPPRWVPLTAAPVLQRAAAAMCQHLGCNKIARDGTSYCHAHSAASFSNMQHLGSNNGRKAGMADRAIESADVAFVSEVMATAAAPAGMMVMHAGGKAAPSGSLNYMVPVGSALVHPAPLSAADKAVIAAATGSKASTYEGLWGRHLHPRFPVDIGADGSGAQTYGIHAKSRPTQSQIYALAIVIVQNHEQHTAAGTQYSFGGDMNVDPAILTVAIERLRPGIITGGAGGAAAPAAAAGGAAGAAAAGAPAAASMFIRQGGDTHRAGGTYDYVITNINPSSATASGHTNLRSGPDHKSINFKH